MVTIIAVVGISLSLGGYGGEQTQSNDCHGFHHIECLQARGFSWTGETSPALSYIAPCSNCTCDPYGMFPSIFQLILFILVYLKLCVKFGKYLTRDFGIIRILNSYLMKIYENFSQISVFLDVYRPFVLKIWRIPPYYYIFSERYY